MARSPGRDAAIAMHEAKLHTSPWPQLFLLLAVSCSLFFARLDTALLEPEETRYAEIPRQMLQADEWVVPLYHGQPYYDKPPLLYWLVMGSYAIFGVHDWAARLVPGLCSVLSVLIVCGWGRAAFGARAGFLGALVLALCARFVYLGRFVATDAPLSLCVLGALACTHLALIGPNLRWRFWIAGGLACGVGLLAKGPTVFVLVGVPAAAYIVANRLAVRPTWRAVAAYFATAILFAAPWYAAVMIRDPNFAEYFFWKHHVLRYVTPFDHPKPFWFYLPEFVAGTLPWSLLLVPIGAELWRDRQALAVRRAPEAIFPLLAATWCVLFFSASGSKRVGYILPAFGPLALVFGIHLDRWLGRANVANSPSVVARVLPLAVLVLGIVGTAGLAAFQYWPMPIAVAVIVAFVGLAVGVCCLRKSLTPGASLVVSCTLMTGMCLVGVHSVLPQYAERFSLRREVLHARDEMHPTARVVCFPRRHDSVNYYLQSDDAIVFTENQREAAIEFLRTNPEAWLFARDGESSRRLLADLPVELTAVQRGHQGSTTVFQIRRLDATTLAP